MILAPLISTVDEMPIGSWGFMGGIGERFTIQWGSFSVIREPHPAHRAEEADEAQSPKPRKVAYIATERLVPHRRREAAQTVTVCWLRDKT